MTIILSQCFDCKHYNEYDNAKHSCKAFPEGIPKDIFNNKKIHNYKIEGQVGNYLFKMKK